ncbi:MAG: amino acid racemase [Veillonellales bacterium]
MKKLGLVGGMGPESTILYYHDIVYGVQKNVGGGYFPNLTIESVNVFEVLRLCREGKFSELVDYLMQAINNLTACGAEFAALSANTPHIVFDELKKKSPIPLVSIIDTACKEAKRRNFTKLGLLGTVFTMTDEFFKEPFIDSGIEIIIPKEQEMSLINEKISGELELGIIKDETLQAFLRIIKRMEREEGIQAIILGCTELPLILNDEVTPIPCLDTMKIHVQALVDTITERL